MGYDCPRIMWFNIMRETKNSSSSHLLTTILLHCMYLQQHSIDLHLSKKCIRSLEVNLGKECWERNECGERRNGREEKGHTTCWTLLNTKKVSACFLLPAALVCFGGVPPSSIRWKSARHFVEMNWIYFPFHASHGDDSCDNDNR